MKVKIIYNGPTADIVRNGMEIARIFYPENSYVDSPVFTKGYPVDEDEKEYGKSIYATNVDGWGHLPGLLPMANTTTKFAQFERAVAEAAAAKAAGEDPKGIEFEVTGYEEEIYWDQMGKNLADQGFEVTIEDKEDPES
jgi:hypothetical protein